MLALSIRQPWAWMILHSGKDIENRTWATRVRGRILIHAAKGMTRAEWEQAMRFAHYSVGLAQTSDDTIGLAGCEFETLERGGFVGSVEIVDCVQQTDSPWFMGSYGFVLRDPQPMPFIPYKGRLGFFEVPFPSAEIQWKLPVTDPYEKYADIFMSSMSGQMSGLTKEQFIELIKSKFPDPAAFVKQMEALTAHAEMQIEQAQAKLKPGQTLGIAYPIGAPRGPLH